MPASGKLALGTLENKANSTPLALFSLFDGPRGHDLLTESMACGIDRTLRQAQGAARSHKVCPVQVFQTRADRQLAVDVDSVSASSRNHDSRAIPCARGPGLGRAGGAKALRRDLFPVLRKTENRSRRSPAASRRLPPVSVGEPRDSGGSAHPATTTASATPTPPRSPPRSRGSASAPGSPVPRTTTPGQQRNGRPADEHDSRKR